jgi:hypothetical protein
VTFLAVKIMKTELRVADIRELYEDAVRRRVTAK